MYTLGQSTQMATPIWCSGLEGGGGGVNVKQNSNFHLSSWLLGVAKVLPLSGGGGSTEQTVPNRSFVGRAPMDEFKDSIRPDGGGGKRLNTAIGRKLPSLDFNPDMQPPIFSVLHRATLSRLVALGR